MTPGNIEAPPACTVCQFCRADRRPEIEERVNVDLIEEHPEAGAHHQSARRLISQARARREVVLIRRENRIHALSLNLQSLSGDEHSQILLAIGMQWAEVLVPQPQVEVQLRRNLPVVLSEKVEPVRDHMPFRITNRYRRRAHIARQKVRQRRRVLVAARDRGMSAAVGRPRPLRPVESERAGGTPEIEFVDPSLPHFSAKAELMLALVIGNDIRKMPCDIVTPFGRRNTYLIEA